MLSLTIRVKFAAAHHVKCFGESHKCARPHGHNYVVDLTFWSGSDEHDFVIEADEAKDLWNRHCHSLIDHRDLNEVEGLRERPTTAENLAKWIMWRLKPALRTVPQACRLIRVTVHETETISATFEDPS